MVELIGRTIRQKPAAQWLEQLEAAGIPAGPINTIAQALGDVQAQHRQMVRVLAGVPLIGSPLRLDGEREDSDLPPPSLGQHTADVLAALGVGAKEVERLRAANVLG
jgi:formyl-CoA transferase